MFYDSYTISGWRAEKSIKSLLEEMVDFNERFISERRPYQYTQNSHVCWDEEREIPEKNFSHLVLECEERLVKDIDNFLADEQWYQERGILYKRGYLFSGEAGNGKTSLCFAIGNYVGWSVHFLSLNDINNDTDLFSLFGQLGQRSIVVLEDVDAAFNKRDGEQTGVSFSALLNCLDGAFSAEKSITILTTNHPEKIDPALIRRGRVDCHVEINNPSLEMINKYITKFYTIQNKKVLEIEDFKNNISMADIQNHCLDYRADLQGCVVAIKKEIKVRDSALKNRGLAHEAKFADRNQEDLTESGICKTH